MRAILRQAKLLDDIGQRDLADRFYCLGEALNDLAEGRSHSLFKLDLKRGSQPDTNEIWRLRTHLCIGIRYLIAGGMDGDKAIALVARKHRKRFQKLLRRGAKSLEGSIHSWLDQFEASAGSNVAQDVYKDGMQRLERDKSNQDIATLRQFGLKLVERTATRTAQARLKSRKI